MIMRKVIFLLLILGILGGVSTVEARSFVFDVSSQEIDHIDGLLVSPFLRIVPDRGNFGTYYVGENLVLTYWSARSGYVSIFNYTSDGKVKIIKNNEPIVTEAERNLYGTITGPEGMERFVMVLSQRMLPDRLLVEAMQHPSQMKNILGEGVYFQKAVIQILTERKMASSFLRFDRLPSEVPAGGKVKIGLFLSDEVGNALVKRRIQWEVSDGILENYQSYTNTAGRAEIWYNAPRVSDALEVKIMARFEGDTVYQGSYGEVTLMVNPDKLQTSLVLSPETFQIASGETLEFQALLRDLRGKPVEGRSIRWMASKGSFEKDITYTDANGQSKNFFFAPHVETSEEVEVKASFAGVRNLLPSEDTSYGTIGGIGVYSGVGMYFLDFTEGKAYTNMEELVYRGVLVSDRAVNPVYALAMKRGDGLEVSFLVSQPLRAGALYFWVGASGTCTLRVLLNGGVIFSGVIREGKVDPASVQLIALNGHLALGRNWLNVVVESSDEEAECVLQRLLVIF
ncbi:MAG: hypothetical protein ACUVQZ_01985 [Candidatus Caldatribacteriaceae bacterium]